MTSPRSDRRAADVRLDRPTPRNLGRTPRKAKGMPACRATRTSGAWREPDAGSCRQGAARRDGGRCSRGLRRRPCGIGTQAWKVQGRPPKARDGLAGGMPGALAVTRAALTRPVRARGVIRRHQRVAGCRRGCGSLAAGRAREGLAYACPGPVTSGPRPSDLADPQRRLRRGPRSRARIRALFDDPGLTAMQCCRSCAGQVH